jgi:hypothetical protein
VQNVLEVGQINALPVHRDTISPLLMLELGLVTVTGSLMDIGGGAATFKFTYNQLLT